MPDFINKIISFLDYLWTIELYHSGDHAIHLNQIVVAISVIIFGFLFSKIIIQSVEKSLLKSGHFNRNTTYVFKRLLHYTLIITFTLVALPIAGIPITIFTIMGSAVAIGIGFGAQNLFNNLISGFIIMTEKPIRIGDIIEVSDHQGRVEEIRNRCVRIRRTDGADLLIPNSYFLQEPVVNWTLLDGEMRGNVTVGVAYGSQVEHVRDLVLNIAKEHHKILHEKELLVLFDDFGDSALIFKILFWAKVTRPMDIKRIQSDLRYKIDTVFKEHRITIAFPQMDVHIHHPKADN